MRLLPLLSYIVGHPLNRGSPLAALSRFMRWQFASRMLDRPVALPFVDDTALVTRRGMTGATGNWYCGLHEPGEMGFVLHALRPGDLFADIGANVGSYTVLAAGAVGCRTITVEPLPATFALMLENVRYNDLADRVEALRCGVSAENGELCFTSGLDTMNRIALPDEDGPTVSVPVRTLDGICAARVPAVIKIDVEGHEDAVLSGGRRTLADPRLAAVIMETNASGARFGHSDHSLVETMRASGFVTCAYDAVHRVLRPAAPGTHNTIFVRDLNAMQERCRTAPRFRLVNGTV